MYVCTYTHISKHCVLLFDTEIPKEKPKAAPPKRGNINTYNFHQQLANFIKPFFL